MRNETTIRRIGLATAAAGVAAVAVTATLVIAGTPDAPGRRPAVAGARPPGAAPSDATLPAVVPVVIPAVQTPQLAAPAEPRLATAPRSQQARPTAAPVVVRASRRPSTIDCFADPTQRRFCTVETSSLTVRDGAPANAASSSAMSAEEPSYPAFHMTDQISPGNGPRTLSVRLEIVNETARTFVFDHGTLELHLTRDGVRMQTPAYEIGSFSMTPGGRAEATFSVPLPGDGSYEWWGETWYDEA